MSIFFPLLKKTAIVTVVWSQTLIFFACAVQETSLLEDEPETQTHLSHHEERSRPVPQADWPFQPFQSLVSFDRISQFYTEDFQNPAELFKLPPFITHSEERPVPVFLSPSRIYHWWEENPEPARIFQLSHIFEQ